MTTNSQFKPYDSDYEETRARNKIERDKAIARLLSQSSAELINLTRANNILPSTLETALASRLEETLLELRSLKEQRSVRLHQD